MEIENSVMEYQTAIPDIKQIIASGQKDCKFYLAFSDEKIVNACVHNLNWTHFRSLLRVLDENTRLWYMDEAAKEGWNARALGRSIDEILFFN